jgi:hypothetical protein
MAVLQLSAGTPAGFVDGISHLASRVNETLQPALSQMYTPHRGTQLCKQTLDAEPIVPIFIPAAAAMKMPAAYAPRNANARGSSSNLLLLGPPATEKFIMSTCHTPAKAELRGAIGEKGALPATCNTHSQH